MRKSKIIITDSNTIKSIRPAASEIQYRRFSERESVKRLMDHIGELEAQGFVEVDSRIKRDGHSYGLLNVTGAWYPAVGSASEAIIDVSYGDVVINISVANPTKSNINDRENWDRGMFDLEARVMKIEKPEITGWKEQVFSEFQN